MRKNQIFTLSFPDFPQKEKAQKRNNQFLIIKFIKGKNDKDILLRAIKMCTKTCQTLEKPAVLTSQ